MARTPAAAAPMTTFAPDSAVRVQAGSVTYPPHGTFGPRVQLNYQLVLVHRGALTIEIDRVPRAICAGEVALLTPGHVERWLAPNTGLQHDWLALHPVPLGAPHLAALDGAAFTLPASDAMRRCFAAALSIREELSQAHAVRTGPGALVLAPRAVLVPLVTAALALYAEEARLLQALAARVDEHPAVVAARQLVRQRLGDHIDLDLMASAAHVTPEHLVVLFRKHLATTPMRYVWSERVRLGTYLLQHTDLPVAEVAARAGFQTSNHFSRLVHAAEGAPPRAVRQRRGAAVT